MLEKLKTSRRYQRIATFVAALAVIAGLFSLAPVRAFASNLLGIFRVERFIVVDVSEERLEQIEAALDGSFFGEQEVLEDPGDPVEAPRRIGTAVTDAAGRFRIEGAPDALLLVRAVPPPPRAGTCRVLPASDPDTLALSQTFSSK